MPAAPRTGNGAIRRQPAQAVASPKAATAHHGSFIVATRAARSPRAGRARAGFGRRAAPATSRRVRNPVADTAATAPASSGRSGPPRARATDTRPHQSGSATPRVAAGIRSARSSRATRTSTPVTSTATNGQPSATQVSRLTAAMTSSPGRETARLGAASRWAGRRRAQTSVATRAAVMAAPWAALGVATALPSGISRGPRPRVAIATASQATGATRNRRALSGWRRDHAAYATETREVSTVRATTRGAPSRSGGTATSSRKVVMTMTGSRSPPTTSRARPTTVAPRRSSSAAAPNGTSAMTTSARGRRAGATSPKAKTTSPNAPTKKSSTPR